MKEIQTLPDRNFIVAGNAIIGNDNEGFVCILSNSGTIINQLQFKVDSKPTNISSMKVFVDGSIVIAGIINDVIDKPFVSLLNKDLSVNWLKAFSIPQSPVKVTMDVTEQEQITLAVQQVSSVISSFLNKDGSLVWTNETPISGLDELVGLGQLLFEELGLIANCTIGGRKEVVMVRLHQVTGNILSSHIIGDGIDESSYKEINTFNNRMITIGITRKTNGQYKLIRNILAQSRETETEHTYDISGTVDFTTTSATDNAGDMLGLCLAQDGKLVAINHFAYYQTGPDHSREYTVPVGSTISGIARSFTDGGYLFGLNTVNASELILIKTDSIGIIQGCGYTDVAINYLEILGRQNTSLNINSGNLSVSSSIANFSTVAGTLSLQTDCNLTYCPPPPPDDTCLASFYKAFRSNSYLNYFQDYFLMKNNRHLVINEKYDRILGNINQLTYGVKLFDEGGNYIKGVNVFYDGVSRFIIPRKVDDQHIMLMNFSTKNSAQCVTFTLIDDDLQIVWSKSVQTYQGFSFNSNNIIDDLVKDEAGNFYLITHTLGFREPAKAIVYKMTSVGDPLWVKEYATPNINFLTANAAVTNGSVVIILEGGPVYSMSLCIDKNTGEVLNSYNYANNPAGSVYDRLVEFSGDRIFYAGNNEQGNLVLAIFDTTGRPLKMNYFDETYGSLPRAGTVKEGMLYIMFNRFDGVFKQSIAKLDTSLTIQFMNEFVATSFGYPVGMGVSDNGSIYAMGNYFSGGVNTSNYSDPYLEKFDPNGFLGTCSFERLSPVITNVDIITTNPVFSVADKTFLLTTIPIFFIPEMDGERISSMPCSNISLCTSVDVTGQEAVCQLEKVYTYHATRNIQCTLQPLWVYDTSFVFVKRISADSINLQFKKTGSTWLKAKLNIGCSVYTDSLLVQIQNAPLNFSLGNDKVLCPGDSIKLNAGNGFSSYLWQNGITNSEFIVSVSGQYHVQVENICGEKARDTVVVTSAFVPELNLGNDSTICAGDTLYLKAVNGFSSYTWESSMPFVGQGPEIYVILNKDEKVNLIAATTDNCYAYDTVNITVNYPRPIYLGKDTSFCTSDSLTLFAGNNYTNYIWNNGFTTSSIIAKQAGIYSVKARDANGCFAKDTMRVLEIYSLPLFSLGSDFDLCKDSKKRLDPGNYSSYLWQNGSNDRYYTVMSSGNYSVKVTDQHGCSSVDSIFVDKILPLPANFLGTIDSICQYDKATIQSLHQYSTYQWSTGSTQPSVTTDKSGQYILTVKDINGCEGKDTVTVNQKNCYTGIFFPNAFTPNRDNLNDDFGAKVYGNVIYFRLQVYNRWGQLVFESTNPQKKWNGSVAGINVDTGIFVWQCYYQLQGADPGYQKGTVTLIR